ncbi:triple tyrosine motif-containing protein, partial [Bacteroidota bacterium]
KDNDNNIWFGTVKGLTKYIAHAERQSLPPPKTHLTDIDLFYKSINWIEKTGNKLPFFNLPQDLLLKYKENHLTFKYSGIYLTNPEKVTYKYILDGLEEAWSPLREDGKVTYPGLPHGEYTFKVMAFNDRGESAENPSTFSFEIKPPFWKTKWFIALCIIVLTALIIFYVKHREKVLQEENRILEEKVRERTAQIRKQNEEIAHQKEHIEHLYKEVTDSIQYAEKIQTAVLPSDELAQEVLEDHFILFKPRDIVSGDFYWLTHIGDLNIFTAADCTGHGVPGAFMSLLGVSFLNDIVNKRGIIESHEILNELRKYIIASFQQEKETTERKEGMDIAISILDKNTKMLQFSGAYNPLYLVRPKKGKNELKIISGGEENVLEPAMEDEKYNLFEVKADKMPAAIYLKMNSFTKHEIQLQKNDRIYMFSDGFADQFGGPDARKYMSKAFKRYFLSIQDQSMQEQKELIDNENKRWMKFINPSSNEEFSQIDDIVIMGVKI